jgi:hypothetical protein
LFLQTSISQLKLGTYRNHDNRGKRARLPPDAHSGVSYSEVACLASRSFGPGKRIALKQSESSLSGEHKPVATGFMVKKGMQNVLAEFFGKSQQLSCILWWNGQFEQRSILMELSDLT